MRYLLLIVFSFYFLSGFPQERNIPSEKPEMVVGIVISGMRYDYISRFWEKYGEDGFKRLVSKGTFCKNVHHDYLIHESSAGLATISTGSYPDVHGIVSDFWYDRLKNNIVYSIHDESVETIGAGFGTGDFSPVKLLTGTLSDELRVSNKMRSKTISISMDPRAAIISGGHTSNSSYWYDDYSGNWISSSFYMDSLSAWVDTFNLKKLPDIYLQKEWKTLYPLEQYTESLPDDNAYESGYKDQILFPYDLDKLSKIRRNQRDYEVLKHTPYGNTFTKDFAIEAIISEKLGKGNHTDWLNVNFSAGGYLGKYYSSWSVEIEDAYLRLDEDIGHFLNFIDDEIGLKNVLIYLTADNGVANEPAYLMDKRLPSGYFNYNSALSLLKTYLNVVYGKGDWVRFYYAQQIYLDRNLIEDSKLSLEDFQDRVARFMVQFEGVSNVLTSSNLLKNNYTRGRMEEIQKSYNQKRSGDVFLYLNQGWIENGPERQYASKLHYVSHVPLVWYGWKIGRGEINRELSVTDIMPTMAVFLDISRSSAMQGRVIQELVE